MLTTSCPFDDVLFRIVNFSFQLKEALSVIARAMREHLIAQGLPRGVLMILTPRCFAGDEAFSDEIHATFRRSVMCTLGLVHVAVRLKKDDRSRGSSPSLPLPLPPPSPPSCANSYALNPCVITPSKFGKVRLAISSQIELLRWGS